MKLRSIFITSIILLLHLNILYAQKNMKSIRVSFYNEATSLPSIKLIQKAFHPTITVGADFWSKTNKHLAQTAGVDLTYFHHQYNEQAIMLDGIYSIGYKFKFGLIARFIVGIGYKHAFYPSEQFKLVNNEYIQVHHIGVAQFNSKFGLGLEMPISKRICITSDYKMMISLPYSEKLPFSAHTFFGVGVRVNLLQRKEQAQ
jgi:hypothetical protein